MKPIFRSPQRAAFVRYKARMILSATRWCLDRTKVRRGFRENCTVCGRLIDTDEHRYRLCYRTRQAFTACAACNDLLKELKLEEDSS